MKCPTKKKNLEGGIQTNPKFPTTTMETIPMILKVMTLFKHMFASMNVHDSKIKKEN
jgi:hypothetical protein